jgi:hypothetical protein
MFDSWGDLGVSSMAWVATQPNELYVTTGSDLIKVDIGKGTVEALQVPGLVDVHEMATIGNILWLANTGRDEAVAYEYTTGVVVRRIELGRLSSARAMEETPSEPGSDEWRIVDKFHLNQVFEGIDGKIYGLVHHASGKQAIKLAATRLLKRQGGGGVINLETGERFELCLRGPHSVRIVNGEYWIFDSGNATINRYDAAWTLKSTLSMSGWGRGSAGSKLGYFFAGISKTRARYLDLLTTPKRSPNMVEIFAVDTLSVVSSVELAHLEQVNNVYVVSRETVDGLLSMGLSAEVRRATGQSDPACSIGGSDTDEC